MQAWAIDPNSAKVYWMNGMAGTGKTTIAYSFCKWLEDNALLAGNYFCSRISFTCSDANRLVPTLAYQLAYYSPPFCEKLYKVLEAKPEASKLDIKWQFEKLLLETLQEIKKTMPSNLVIVIDALDECNDNDTLQLFLQTLVKLAAFYYQSPRTCDS